MEEHLKKPFRERVNSEPEKIDVINDILKDEALIKQAGTQYGGQFFKSHKLGMDRVEERFKSNKRSKGL